MPTTHTPSAPRRSPWEDAIGHRRVSLRPVSSLEHLLAVLGPSTCGLCDTPVPSPTSALCPTCEETALLRIQRLSFGEVYSCFEHRELARRAVTGLKYRQERWRGFQLAQYAALQWFAQEQRTIRAHDLLVPIPLHPQRVRQRGFNQALVIARGIQQRIPLRVDATALVRRDAPLRDQKSLGRQDRLAQKDRFVGAKRLAGRRVWLVDDVITTGATLEDAASAVRDAGGTPIGGITLNWR